MPKRKMRTEPRTRRKDPPDKPSAVPHRHLLLPGWGGQDVRVQPVGWRKGKWVICSELQLPGQICRCFAAILQIPPRIDMSHSAAAWAEGFRTSPKSRGVACPCLRVQRDGAAGISSAFLPMPPCSFCTVNTHRRSQPSSLQMHPAFPGKHQEMASPSFL